MGVYYPQSAVILRITWEGVDRGTVGYGAVIGTNAAIPQFTLSVVPRRLEVNINSYKEADTFSMDLDYKNFPFDPRSMRSVGVSIHMQDMGKLRDDQGEEVRIVPSPENVVFQGFADEESIKLDESSGTITLSGRDFTSLLIDRPFINADGKMPTLALSKPLDIAIQELLDSLQEARSIEVVNRTGAALPTIAKFAGDYNALAGRKSSERKDKYWEVIQDLVFRAALICYIEIDKLVITSPRVLYGETKAKQFIYGKNLKSLDFNRKMGRVKGFNIQVQCLDYLNKKVLTAKIPEQASDAWIRSIGIPKTRIKIPKAGANGQVTQEDAPFLVFNVPNINDQAHLVAIGEKTFEEVGRQEIEGTLTTKDMLIAETSSNNLQVAAVGGKSKAVKLADGFDITKIRNATPIAILMDWDDLQAISQETDYGTRVQYLKERAYSEEVASALAGVIGKYSSIFYTRSVQFTMDSEEGFVCEITFINYVRAPEQ